MMYSFNKNLSKIQTSKIRQFDTYCSQFKDVIKLTLGQPLFPTPALVKEKAIEALHRNITTYTPNRGTQIVRETILRYCKQHFDVDYDLEEIIVGVGTTEVLAASLCTILNEGDEVIIPAPSYSGYEPLVLLNNSIVRTIDTAPDGFQLTVENLKKYITPKTKCIILTDPSNPTGASLNRKNRDELVAFLATTNIFVIADEVYNRILYTDDYKSFGAYPELRKQLIVVNSFSKSHSMTGWRLGWGLAGKEVIDQIAKVHQYYVTAASTIGQYALQAILDPQTEKELAHMTASYRANMEHACDTLARAGFVCKPPQGAFYLYLSTANFGMDGDTFARRLVQEANVAIIPGDAFGDAYKDYVRISYCVDKSTLTEALRRIAAFAQAL
ncbi:MAG: aminotransferase class I/II-fold pyridoxal phosphate-dependent enzyme [Prevotellaceae bacterium]|jgi:aminotransferase|nr:aminotransferase class I/II-fold pyridoxal phosphate-dependent enzyme [Prevotellaceae bacterium]